MDEERARELLAAERRRVEAAITARGSGEAELDAEQDLGVGLSEDLADRLGAIERAEQRLADGTYGLSVLSGAPIPDERLEALPTAELTVEEQRQQPG
jgi:DnaK suppressor protein